MNIKTAQKRVDQIAAAMIAKGMREPSAGIRIESDREMQVCLKWKSGINHDSWLGDDKYQFFRGDDMTALLAEADAFVASQPDIEQQKLNDYLAALAKCIDLGRKHGIDDAHINPLFASMKKLSENIITDQRAA